MWPPPWLGRGRKRPPTLAVLREDHILLETGELLRRPTSWETLAQLVAGRPLWLYVACMERLPWFGDMLQDRHTEVLGTGAHDVLGARVRRGRGVGWALSAPIAWGRQPSPDLLRDLRALEAHLGVALGPTAGATGQATMAHVWQHSQAGICPRPHQACLNQLKAAKTGGRVDYCISDPHQVWQTIYELDINAAYPAAFRDLPGGAAHYWCGLGPPPDAPHLWLWCSVTIPQALPLGAPFHPYPCQAGEYTTWLWDFQIKRCRELGMAVSPHYGWYWTRTERWANVWGRWMYMKRKSAGEGLYDLIKRLMVAGIGVFGSEQVIYQLRTQPGGEIVCSGELGIIDVYVHSRPRDRGTCQMHWYNRTIALANMHLHDLAYKYAIAGELLGTNYDAVYITGEAGGKAGEAKGQWGEKQGILQLVCDKLGGIKIRQLHHVRLPRARWVIAQEHVATPGIPAQFRGAYVEET